MWDIGDGQPKVQHLPYVRYNYSVPGNYTVKLKVDAYWNKTGSRYQSPRTASYITDLKVLDAVRTIEVTAPSSVKVDQGTSLSVCITGSPPVVLCWVMVPDCVAVSPTPCHLVMLYGNTLYLNYTFTSTGRYCLNMTARNDISSLQSSHDITVSKGVTHPVFFILPCATLIIISLGFIIFSVCRPHRSAAKIRVEVWMISLFPLLVCYESAQGSLPVLVLGACSVYW
ncbi:TM130 protein, partial [Amia calva]|nr:TM130 protein [Amia calva]